MKSPLSLLSLTLVVALLGCDAKPAPGPVIGAGSTPEAAGTSETRPDEATDNTGESLTLSASELARQWILDPQATEERWSTKTILVTGVVDEIIPNRLGGTFEPVFDHRWVLRTGEFTAHYEVTLDCTWHGMDGEASRQTLAGIRIGQTVTVRGVPTIVAGVITLEKAQIIASEPAPEDAPPAEELVPTSELSKRNADYEEGRKAAEGLDRDLTDKGTFQPEVLAAEQKMASMYQHIRQPISAAGLRELATLTGVRELTLNEFADDVDAAAFGELANLPHLASLTLGSCSEELLAALPACRRLRSVTLEGDTQLSEVGARHLAAIPQLTYLMVRRIDDGALRELSAAAKLRKLTIEESQDLTGSMLTGLGNLPQLISLHVPDCQFAPDGVRGLAAMRSLRALTIRKPPFADGSLMDFGDMEFLDNLGKLQNLSLSGNAAPGCGARIASLADLRHVTIRSPQFTDDELVAFAAKPKPNLSEINLNGCPIGDAGVEALAKQQWPKLERLMLEDTKIGDAALVALAAGTFPRLKLLDVSGTNVTADGLDAVRLPQVKEIRAKHLD